MNHRWETISTHRQLTQKCKRCGVIRRRESTKQLMAITQTPPYYHYRYESVWSYMYDGKKTLIRPNCEPVEVTYQ